MKPLLSYSEKSKKFGKNQKRVNFPSLSPFLGVKEHLVRHDLSIQFFIALNLTSNMVFAEKYIEPFSKNASLKIFQKSCKKKRKLFDITFSIFNFFKI
jgi:hypothetical protein